MLLRLLLIQIAVADHSILIAAAALFLLPFVFIVLTATAYGVAAFRPDEAPAFVTVGFNDLGSFFAAVWTPFSLWYIAIALAIFRDKGHVPVYPRWVAYANGDAAGGVTRGNGACEREAPFVFPAPPTP